MFGQDMVLCRPALCRDSSQHTHTHTHHSVMRLGGLPCQDVYCPVSCHWFTMALSTTLYIAGGNTLPHRQLKAILHKCTCVLAPFPLVMFTLWWQGQKIIKASITEELPVLGIYSFMTSREGKVRAPWQQIFICVCLCVSHWLNGPD